MKEDSTLRYPKESEAVPGRGPWAFLVGYAHTVVAPSLRWSRFIFGGICFFKGAGIGDEASCLRGMDNIQASDFLSIAPNQRTASPPIRVEPV